MTKQVMITIEGPDNTGKTFLLEKIYDMLKAEGIETTIKSPDDNCGIWKKWKESGEPIPTLKEVLDRLQVDVILVEKHLSRSIALDLHNRWPASDLASETKWEIETLRDVTNMLKRMVRHRRIYTVMVDDALDLKDVSDALITEYASGDYPEVEFMVSRGPLSLPDYGTEPLVIIYPVALQPDGLTINRSIPLVLNFLTTTAVYIKDDGSMIYVRNKSKETGVQITVKEWADDIDFTPVRNWPIDDLLEDSISKTSVDYEREFFNTWTPTEPYLDVTLETDRGVGHSNGRVSKVTAKELLEIGPITFTITIDDVEHTFVKCGDSKDVYATLSETSLPGCFQFMGNAVVERNGSQVLENHYRLIPFKKE